ncbi:hypothetical protein [Burkholderia ubonensis]|uniref:Uncharacterized protein n=1 Tax=Burkholderia ubonensis TaxID=101571 RepID=A0AB74D7T1_9BURK|nr:hypothetical protein [Burkholderia ubonensis]PAJ79685.1 hypothetical protein CJO71_16680 [Burkholderia ubonensis]PAJ87580.1 hypothetical protein CJO70_10665 [Burkholderia ubonensis]PAJ90432.1 hypothetical protein CJO69_32815 [Burkholderia ubonensis]PAK00238.1 hypothetical protein CJO68_15060 [Burkholderia ubonensis]PAK07964.1 hypothetical protein CJO67_10005 [Burkholderia ubonensis]
MNEQVSDEVVQYTIKHAIFLARGCQGNIVDQVECAFRWLQARRRKHSPEDINLAAAEHYMYARFLAGDTGDPLVKATPILYGAKKRVYFALGIQDKMATSPGPVLAPNRSVERWGLKGATEGLRDYSAVNHGQPANRFGASLRSLSKEALRYNGG